MNFVMDFEQITSGLFPKVGGKNANLGEMMRVGNRVPPGFAVTTDSYDVFLKQKNIREEISKLLQKVDLSNTEELDRVSAEIRTLIETSPIPAEIEAEIEASYLELSQKCDMEDISVAVRSSATAEDLPTASFAGQQDTYLYIKGSQHVMNAVRRCWASLFTSRAIVYRSKNEISHEKTLISVGIQKMVNAKTAGVLFTLNPANGDPSQVVIEGCWGLGEAVVSGNVTPDHFMINKISLETSKKLIAKKEIKYVPTADKADVEHVEVPLDAQLKPCLEEQEIVELIKIAKRLEKYYGCPQDVEWAIDSDLNFPENVFILQSRPETVWSQKKSQSRLANKSSRELLMEQARKIIRIGV